MFIFLIINVLLLEIGLVLFVIFLNSIIFWFFVFWSNFIFDFMFVFGYEVIWRVVSFFVILLGLLSRIKN